MVQVHPTHWEYLSLKYTFVLAQITKQVLEKPPMTSLRVIILVQHVLGDTDGQILAQKYFVAVRTEQRGAA